MPTNTGRGSRGSRLLLIAALLILFSGGILYSIRAIRYAVDGEPTTELQVTKLSLTHEVDRGIDGKLINPYKAGSPDHAGVTAAKSEPSAQKPAIKKPATKPPVKQLLNKPLKKPVRKPVQKPARKPATKPVKKPAQKPQACPT